MGAIAWEVAAEGQSAIFASFAPVGPKVFGANLMLLLAVLVVLLIVAAMVLAVWVWLRIRRTHARQREAQRQAELRRIGPDGRPYPPRARGLCEACQGLFNTVYHLPSGRRLCEACYAEAVGDEAERTAPAEPA
jgi:hypothetical protein